MQPSTRRIALFFCLLLPGAGLLFAQPSGRDRAQQFIPSQSAEVKKIIQMILDNEPQDKVLMEWKSLLGSQPAYTSWEIPRGYIGSEIKRRMQEQVNEARLKLAQQLQLESRLHMEITQVRSKLDGSGGISWQPKTFELSSDGTVKVENNGRLITERVKLEAYLLDLEKYQEALRDRRREAQTSFENYDQKANQLFNILSTILKTMKEMEQSVSRNMN